MPSGSRAAEMLTGRLQRNRRHLGRWARREGISCWRVYDRDMPDVPVTIDDYEGRLVIADARSARVDEELDRGWLDEVVTAATAVLAPAEVHVKERRRMADRRASGAQYQRLGEQGAWHEVGEGGRRFLVNLADYLDTGLFLDHRQTRALVAAEARGRRSASTCRTPTSTGRPRTWPATASTPAATCSSAPTCWPGWAPTAGRASTWSSSIRRPSPTPRR
jgi:23S rRNA (guanine2445-N2)-methyltransferase / 23S rRNA (guanine2069-N7)-methyltransferase